MLTERERACLEYLNFKMEANARLIGEHLTEKCGYSGGYQAVGSGVVGSLRGRGFVTYLSDLHAWRITTAGREALKA